jgi:hypothetical protein
MNVINRPAGIVEALVGEPSFAEVIAAIDKADDLGPVQKRHWPTALRQMGLSPFFRFLSAEGVRPDDVRDVHVEAFIAYRKEASF